jgi:aryl-alcohol dehydrogenase-like predicted oxidoreductase
VSSIRSEGSLATEPSVGLGTYLGDATDEADAHLEEALDAGIDAGIDVIDTALNYRQQRSERVIGRVLRRLDDAARDEITLFTKAGFVPWEALPPRDEEAYYRERVIATGLAEARELAPGGHCIAPRYLRWSVAQSLANLGVARVDVVFVHNPEAQRTIASQDEVYARLRRAFEALESLVQEGCVGAYGVATWEAFRQAPDGPEHLSLARIVEAAREVAGARHRLRFVQAPLSLLHPEGVTRRTQTVPGAAPCSLVSAARSLGVQLITSAPLGGGELRTMAPDALDFARSAPGVSRALLGVRTAAHAALAISRTRSPRLDVAQLLALLARLD